MEDMKVKKALGAANFLQEVLSEMNDEAPEQYDDAAKLIGEVKGLIENYVKDKLFAQWISE